METLESQSSGVQNVITPWEIEHGIFGITRTHCLDSIIKSEKPTPAATEINNLSLKNNLRGLITSSTFQGLRLLILESKSMVKNLRDYYHI